MFRSSLEMSKSTTENKTIPLFRKRGPGSDYTETVNRDPKYANKGHAIKVSAKLLALLTDVLEYGKTDHKTLKWKSKIRC